MFACISLLLFYELFIACFTLHACGKGRGACVLKTVFYSELPLLTGLC